MTTFQTLVREAPLPRKESEILLFHVFDCDRSWLYAHGDDPVTRPEATPFLGKPVNRLRIFWVNGSFGLCRLE